MKFYILAATLTLIIPTPGSTFAASTQSKFNAPDSNSKSNSSSTSTSYVPLPQTEETTRYVWVGINAAPLAAGTVAGTPIAMLDLGVRVFDNFSIGPTATFTGTYKHDDTDFKLSGFGAQAMYNFGHDAIADGFYIQGFFQHYSLSASKMSSIDMGFGAMPFPLEGSVGLNSLGGAIGYQWIWANGFRLSTGVRVAYVTSDSSSLEVMGMNREQVSQAGSMMAAMNGQQAENIDIPVIEDRQAIIPVPELSVGWAF